MRGDYGNSAARAMGLDRRLRNIGPMHVETIEGLTERHAIAELQREFVARNALQCGYCTPGVLVTAAELLARGKPTRAHIREALSGNYCRCTGYQAIVDAIDAVAARHLDGKP